MAINRTMVAILAADVAGYSRLVAEDEEGMLARFAQHDRVFRDQTARYEGRIFSTAGDSFMAEFPSAVLALRAALAIQERAAELNIDLPAERRVEFRMGITIGDVMERGDELMGDGVNIAARLQTLADPGGICVSRSVHEAVGTKVQVEFRDIGPQKLKNIPRPVPVLRVVMKRDRDLAAAKSGRVGRLVRIGSAAAAVVGAGALGWWLIGSDPAFMRSRALPALNSEAEAAVRTALTVSVDRPRQRCFQDQVRLAGTILPRDEVEVRPEGEGYKVARLLAEPGMEVQAGQVLAQLVFLGNANAQAVVRAPVAGTIGKMTAYPGALTSPQAPALFTLISNGELEFVAQASVDDLSQVQTGQSVLVTPVGGKAVPGRVRTVAKVADPASQAVPVRVSVPSDASLRWGVFARGLVAIGERCGLAVPFSSLLRGQDGTAVFVVNDNNVEARPVTTGLSSGDDIEIRSGISATDRVVQQAGPFLREGDLIRTVETRK